MTVTEPILMTPRLRLDRWREADLDDLYDLHADPRVQVGYIPDPEKWTREGIERRLATYLHEQDAFGITKWKLSLRDGTFIGRGGWSPWEADEIEIGYAVKPDFQGKGYALEITRALIEWGLEVRRERLIGFALLDNAASRHILEKSGMILEGERPVDDVPMAFYAVDR